MCGIYGFQVRPGHKLTEYEATLMSLVLASEMESRGRDSYGGVSIPMKDDEDKQAHIVRGIGKVSEGGSLLFKQASKSRCFLGHTRAATKGAVILENCHPFRIGDVLGVHNGIIQNSDQLDRKYNRDFKVDSMHVFGHINDGLPFDDLYGYGTFFWLRASENWSTIYFAKTTAGSLTVANLYRNPKITSMDTKEEPFLIVWASEHRAIQRVAHLLNLGYHSMHIEAEKVHTIHEGTVYKQDTPFVFGGMVNKGANFEEVFPWGIRQVTSTQSGGPHYDIDLTRPNCHIPANKSNQGGGGKGQKNLSRKQRKALKKQHTSKESDGTFGWAEDPIPENLVSGMGMQKVYLPINGTSGRAKQHFLCPDCKCLVDNHIWSWCPNNGDESTSCEGEPKEGCLIPAPVCVDCGHYLIEGIHEEAIVSGLHSLVHCTTCQNYCAPEAMIVQADAAKKEEDQQEREIAAALADAEDEVGETKPTEIVLPASSKPMLTESIISKELQKLKEFNGTS